MKNKIELFEILKLKQKELNAEIDELNKEIKEFMLDQDATETPKLPMGGIIKVQEKKSWEYPQEIKDMMKKAELDGTATQKVSQFIQYYPGKPEHLTNEDFTI